MAVIGHVVVDPISRLDPGMKDIDEGRQRSLIGFCDKEFHVDLLEIQNYPSPGLAVPALKARLALLVLLSLL